MNGQLLSLWAGTNSELTNLEKITAGTLYYDKTNHSFSVGVGDADNAVLEPVWVKELVYHENGVDKSLTIQDIKNMHSDIIESLMPQNETVEERDSVILARLKTEENGESKLTFISSSALDTKHGGTGQSFDTQTGLINNLIGQANNTENIKNFINQAGSGTNKLNYVDAANINGSAVQLQVLTSTAFVEGASLKIKLKGDLPTEAVINFKNSSDNYLILDSQGNKTKGNEVVANGYLEIICSDQQVEGYKGICFFKSGGTNGGRPRKLKGSVSFTEDAIFCPADYGLQVNDKITVTLVNSGGYSTSYNDYNDFLYNTSITNFNAETSIENLSYTSPYNNIGLGGYIPNFPAQYGKMLDDADYIALAAGKYIRKYDNMFNTAGLLADSKDYYTYDYNRQYLLSLDNIPHASYFCRDNWSAGLGYGSSQTGSKFKYHKRQFVLKKQLGKITNSNELFIKVGMGYFGSDTSDYPSTSSNGWQRGIANFFSDDQPFIVYNKTQLQCLQNDRHFRRNFANFKRANPNIDYNSLSQTKIPGSGKGTKVWIRATYASGGFLDNKGTLWTNQGIFNTDIPKVSDVMQDCPLVYYLKDKESYYWIDKTQGIDNKPNDLRPYIRLLQNGVVTSINKIEAIINLETQATEEVDFSTLGVRYLTAFANSSALLITLGPSGLQYIYAKLDNTNEYKWYKVTGKIYSYIDNYSILGRQITRSNSSDGGYSYAIENNQINIIYDNDCSPMRQPRSGFYYSKTEDKYFIAYDGKLETGLFKFYLNLTTDVNNDIEIRANSLVIDDTNKQLITMFLPYEALSYDTKQEYYLAPGYCEISWDIDET